MSDVQITSGVMHNMSGKQLVHGASAILFVLAFAIIVITAISMIGAPLMNNFNDLKAQNEKISPLETALKEQQNHLAQQLTIIGAGPDELEALVTSSWAVDALEADAEAMTAILVDQGFTLENRAAALEKPLTEILSSYKITITARGNDDAAAALLADSDMPQSFLASASLTREDGDSPRPFLLSLTLSRLGAKSEPNEGTSN
ncbi:MAG: hypothetical protein DHS20C05_16720 [Hyphococcus sp.]|nr:MAG: hypothetical protein DHS20C05_16720 [Marinicaulis sp.]